MKNMIWKNIERLNGKYAISNTGLIRNNETEKILKTRVNKSTGYESVTVKPTGRYGKCYCLRIHREMCLLFLDNPENKPQINHIDGNKTNNSLDNFEWVTSKENVRHALDTGLTIPPKGEEKHNSKLTEENVRFILDNPDLTMKDLSKELGVSQHTIYNIRHRKKWKHVI